MLHGSLAVVALLSLCALLTAAPGAAQAAGNPVVVIDTNFGEITLELDQDKAPITTANFLKYTDAKFFDG
ncbi:MAG: peptidylprolyl isomerase, partial [Planctomycetota bacterium]|nr:peptidylprolyl isomerase [Planctomycetota bacterium]